ncbi:MAG: hypothetical protein WD354_10995, partial [Acidimicrobiia bacterium]
VEGRNRAVSLPMRSVVIAGACLGIASVALLRAHAMAIRGTKPDMEETLSVVPTDAGRRRSGEIAASLAPALLAVAVVAAGLSWSIANNPAGSINWLEVAVGPLVVVLFHAIGVALGRFNRPLVGPLFLVVMAGLFLAEDLWPGERPESALSAASPFLPWRAPYTNWVQGEPRLPLMHLVFLGGLISLVGALTIKAWRWVSGAAVALGATVLVLAGIPSRGEGVIASVSAWAHQQVVVCMEQDRMRYCAFEGYEPWIEYWSDVVERTRAVVPVDLSVTEIRQSVDYRADDVDALVAYVGGSWYLRPQASHRRDLAAELLAPTLGLPATRGESAQTRTDLPECMRSAFPVSVFGQARGVGYLVLLETAVPEILPLGDTSRFGGVGQVEVSPGELDLARQILTRTMNERVATLHEHWNELADPSTTSATLAGWFGLEPPPHPENTPMEDMNQNMNCVCTGNGGVSCTSRGTP